MKIRTLAAVCGLAVGSTADAQFAFEGAPRGQQDFAALRATAITGRTVDGRYVFGRTIELGTTNTNRFPPIVAYDSGQLDGLMPMCSDVFPHTFPGPSFRYIFNADQQSIAEDIVPHPGTEGGVVDSVAFAGIRQLCQGGSPEQLSIVFESWEGFDNFPDLDGSDGFDTDGDGLGFPASLSDTDGDTFVDEFLGGVLLDYGVLPSGGAGYTFFTASGLSTLGVSLTSNLDLWDGGKPGTDGRPDGGVRVLWTRGDGGDGMGPLAGGLYPASNVRQVYWGTLAMEVPGTLCPFAGQPGFGVGDSDGTVWGEGENICGDASPGWSEGAPSGNTVVDDRYDVLRDIRDFNGQVQDFTALGAVMKISIANPNADCCDANNDGSCTPADFSAWVAAFNAGGPRCDTNQDGSCTPADFSGWIAAFNASQIGNEFQCSF